MEIKRNLSFPAFCLLALLLTCAISSAQNNAAQAGVLTKSEFNRATHFDVSPPLRDLINSQPIVPFGYHVASPALKPKLQKQLAFAAARQAASGQAVAPQNLAPVAATVGVNVLGVGVGFHGYSVPDAPTDSNGASGDWPGNQANAQVVEWVNVSYAVFRKSDGAYLAGPILGNALWAGFGGSCQTSNSGDIIAQFDKAAHRWVLFQPVFSSPFASCFAISTSPDALGTYYRYSFPQVNGFPDYPKLGIQPEAYYQQLSLSQKTEWSTKKKKRMYCHSTSVWIAAGRGPGRRPDFSCSCPDGRFSGSATRARGCASVAIDRLALGRRPPSFRRCRHRRGYARRRRAGGSVGVEADRRIPTAGRASLRDPAHAAALPAWGRGMAVARLGAASRDDLLLPACVPRVGDPQQRAASAGDTASLTILPLTPAGIGTDQVLLVYVLAGQASKSALLSLERGDEGDHLRPSTRRPGSARSSSMPANAPLRSALQLDPVKPPDTDRKR